MNKHITVSLPGKVMLAGEYSILRGEPALAAAVSPRFEVTAVWEPGPGLITITSDLWSLPREFNPSRPPTAPGPAGAAALAAYRLAQSRQPRRDPGQLRLRIRSGWPVSYGLGSSSAVRLGILLAVRGFDTDAPPPHDDWETARQSFELQRSAQGLASGYDIMTQLRGGVIALAQTDQQTSTRPAWPGSFRSLELKDCPRLALLQHAAGPQGSDTAQLVPRVAQALDEQNLWPALHTANADWQAALLGTELTADATDSLIAACTQQRQVMAQLPGFPTRLAERLSRVLGCDSAWSWKTTGAGGEDSLAFVLPQGWPAELRQALDELHFSPWSYSWEGQGARLRHEGEA